MIWFGRQTRVAVSYLPLSEQSINNHEVLPGLLWVFVSMYTADVVCTKSLLSEVCVRVQCLYMERYIWAAGVTGEYNASLA